MLNDVTIIKAGGGLGRRNPSTDMVSGLITMGVAVAGKLTLGTVYQLFSADDAAALGIDAEYDTAGGVQVHYHISEFFRINPDGELWLIVVAQATDFADLVDPTKNIATKMLDAARGRIVQVGVAFNTPGGYAATLTDGLDDQVFEAVTQAQLLAVRQDSVFAPVSAVLIDGREYNGTSAAAKDLRTLNASKVSVLIGRDGDVAAQAKSSAIGTALGVLSAAKVNENVAWVEKFNVSDELKGKFINVGFTSTTPPTLSDLNTLNSKGYLFFRNIAQISGAYLNDSHTAVASSSDFAYIENNRTLDKAAKGIRAAILPKLGSPLQVDSTTGRIAPETAKSFELLGQAVLDDMQRQAEISGGDSYVDEKQNVLQTSLLKVKFGIVTTGVARQIEATVGFENPFNS